MFSIQEDEEDYEEKKEAKEEPVKPNGSSLSVEPIAEEAGDAGSANKEKAKSEDSGSEPPKRKKEKRQKRRSGIKIGNGASSSKGGEDEKAPQATPPGARRQRERAIALPGIILENNRSAKSLWSKGKMKGEMTCRAHESLHEVL